MKDKFNRYCAGVAGYVIAPDHLQIDDNGIMLGETPDCFVRDFYNDLNDMTEVVEKLVFNHHREFHQHMSGVWGRGAFIKQTFRDFIISAMPEEDESNE